MAYAIAHATERITPGLLRGIHRRLLEGTAGARYAGVVRTDQNWIGGGGYSPIGARYVPPPPEEVPDSHAAQATVNEWVALFAGAASRAVADAQAFEMRVREIERGWEQRLTIRTDASAQALLRQLVRSPIDTANTVAEALGASYNAANGAIATLVEAGILSSTRAGRRNRAFEARELVEAFAGLERGLASPAGDTWLAPPVRNVPRYRRR